MGHIVLRYEDGQFTVGRGQHSTVSLTSLCDEIFLSRILVWHTKSMLTTSHALSSWAMVLWTIKLTYNSELFPSEWITCIFIAFDWCICFKSFCGIWDCAKPGQHQSHIEARRLGYRIYSRSSTTIYRSFKCRARPIFILQSELFQRWSAGKRPAGTIRPEFSSDGIVHRSMIFWMIFPTRDYVLTSLTRRSWRTLVLYLMTTPISSHLEHVKSSRPQS